MTRSVTTAAEISPDHTLTVSLPTDMPPGPATVTVTIGSEQETKINTLGELLESGLLGDWADREDLPTTNEEFIEWRRKLWERKAS